MMRWMTLIATTSLLCGCAAVEKRGPCIEYAQENVWHSTGSMRGQLDLPFKWTTVEWVCKEYAPYIEPYEENENEVLPSGANDRIPPI